MLLRTLFSLSLVALLAACSREPVKPVAPKVVAPLATQASQQPQPLGPLPVYQRELSGSLLGAPVGADVELALMVIDDRGRPQRMLGNLTVTARTAGALPFQLRYNPDAFPLGGRVELRGRAIQSGILIMHLAPQTIREPQTLNLGQLQLLTAP